ncbi:FAD binding domain-containing protein [Actinoplanes philippinensis]|uniref:FAD binding domain-containing protein n=2 Tax=Actinoplanes philippinensis TaxID=35752 RepID=A0A1I2G482_9ACTN|nr:FAD binding domain-containing protein [Actinoplanes philippinensis]
MLACELRLGGAEVVLLEQRPAPSGLSKALGLSGRAVQILQSRGLLDRFDPGPVPASGFARYAHLGGIPLDVGRLLDSAPEGRYPPYLPVRQAEVERVLEDRARELGVDIRRGHEVTGLAQSAVALHGTGGDGLDGGRSGPDGGRDGSDAGRHGSDGGRHGLHSAREGLHSGRTGLDSGRDGIGGGRDEGVVTIDVRADDGGAYRMSARYVVGCDGARSVVRKQAGIGFPGTPARQLSRFGDVVLAAPPGVAPGMTRTENGHFALIPLGDGVHRVVTTEWGRDVDHDTPLTLDELDASVRRVIGADLAMTEPRWLSRFTDAARQADRYRAGRVFVAGDAAHIQLPAGGPGVTTGLQDAVNLGWKLAAEITGWAPPGLLDTYHTERHPAGARMLAFTRAQGLLLSPGDDAGALRDVIGELVGAHDDTLRHVLDRILHLDVRYEAGPYAHPLTGTWAPDLGGLSTLLNDARPVLIDLTPDQRLHGIPAGWANRIHLTSAQPDLALSQADPVSVRTGLPSTGTDTAAAQSGQGFDGMLVRPDGHLAWAGTHGLSEALTSWFGEPSAVD